MAYSADGSWIASAAAGYSGGKLVGGEVKIWDAVTAKSILTLPEASARSAEAAFICVRFSPDGLQVAAGCEDYSVRLWDAKTGKPLSVLRGHSDRVEHLAYAPNGKWLATGGRDRTIKIWDTATGNLILAMPVQTSAVSALVFSPDGQRLISATNGISRELPGEIKIWDANTGQEILALQGQRESIHSLALNHDGSRVAAGAQGAVLVWDAAPLTAGMLEQREARGVVRCRLAEALPAEQVFARLRADMTLRDTFRQKALVLAAVQGRNQVRREAEALVFHLFAQFPLRALVLQSSRGSACLGEPLRKEALAIAEHFRESPLMLNCASREVVLYPGPPTSTYELALQRIERAIELAPCEGSFQETLGMTQYRMGRFAEAAQTLMQAEKLTRADTGVSPTNLAFLAMSQHRAGQADAARTTLQRLRQIMREPRWAKDTEAKTTAVEAESVVAGKPAGGKK